MTSMKSMKSNVLKYVKYVKGKYVNKSAAKYVLPVLIFAGIASMSGYHLGYHISQKQEQKKHSSDNIGIKVEDYGDNFTLFSIEGTLSGQSFSISNLERYEPNSHLVKFGSRYNQLENIIKEEIVHSDGYDCYDQLDVKASRYDPPTDDFLATKIKITPKYRINN